MEAHRLRTISPRQMRITHGDQTDGQRGDIQTEVEAEVTNPQAEIAPLAPVEVRIQIRTTTKNNRLSERFGKTEKMRERGAIRRKSLNVLRSQSREDTEPGPTQFSKMLLWRRADPIIKLLSGYNRHSTKTCLLRLSA